MAKKKIKITSPVDLSEHVVEVDAATTLPLGAEPVTDDGVHVELPLPPEAILGRPDARDEVTARVEAMAKQAEPVTDNELYKAWNSAPPGKMVPYRREDEASRYGGYELRKIPEGMNKFNSTNEWLMLILESLYRIERKLGA